MSQFFQVFQVAALVVFLILFIGRAVQLRVARGVSAFHIAAGKELPQALLEGLFLVGLTLWLYEVLAHAWPLPWHPLPDLLHRTVLDSLVLRGIGAALVATGLFLFGASLVSFGDSWRVGIDRESPGELVTSGVFAWSRNPIFLFMDCYALGTFLITGDLVFGLIALLVVVALHYQILHEERFLESRYGEPYLAYCASTSRYIGRPRS